MQSSTSARAAELTKITRNSAAFELKVIQEPLDGRALPIPEKTRGARWPLDPPPVVEFNVHDNDQNRTYLHSPFWFCTAELDPISPSGAASAGNGLIGTTVSSLHKVKLNDNKERGFFIFGDLHVKMPGTHRIRFSLFELREGEQGMVAEKLNAVHSKGFKVHQAKSVLPLRESTPLSRTLCEAGVKLRIRKESTKRKSQCVDWSSAIPHSVHHRSHYLPPPNPAMPPPLRPFSIQVGPNFSAAGENITHRLSVGSASLGIRDHMDKVGQENKSRQMIAYKSPENWFAPHQAYSTQNYPSESTWYSTPDASPQGNDFRTGFAAPFSNGVYNPAQLPPSPYSTVGSGGQVQADQNQGRGANHQMAFDQQLFHQSHRAAEDGTNGDVHHDPAHMQQYAMNSFPGSGNLGYGGAGSAYPAYGTNSRNYTMASTSGGVDGVDVNHF